MYSKREKSAAEVFLGCGFLLVLFVGVVALFGACWQYSLNQWLDYAGKDVNIAYWEACLISCIPGVGQIAFPVAFITWVMMMFLS